MAIVHDWLDTWRGGESALAEICGLFPDADLYALVDFMSDEDRKRLNGRRASTTFLQHLPFARRHFRALLPLFPRAIESLDMSSFDVIISSSHAVAKGVRTRADQLHICYCYTPMRYAWDLREQYLEQTGLVRGVRGLAAKHVLDRLRVWDERTAHRVTEFIAISHHVADRIRRCYGRTSTVIYPPVTLRPTIAPDRGPVYVTVSQLVPYKRVDLIVAAFAQLPDRELVVIGEGPERSRIQATASSNVRLLGRIPDDERDAWLSQARAFVFAAEEDFGIAPLEAQAMGTPVIAFRKGGSLETINDLDSPEPTGVLFEAQTAAGIVEAIHTFEANRDRIDPDACRRNAARFAAPRFRREFMEFVDERLRPGAPSNGRS
ncbi:MAG: glycosyltransferase [Pseudomonadota bacterium]|nr:glycosyltransferase [Pseudomonadota bacterium]